MRVPAASTIVNAGDVTSTLLDETVCGLMRDGVTGIPTAQLQEQVSDLIDNLRDVIAGVEAGSEVMLKSTYGGSEDGVVKSTDKLQTARKIGLANFDGTADITVDQIGAVPKTGGSFTGSVTAKSGFRVENNLQLYDPDYPNLQIWVTGTESGRYISGYSASNGYIDYIIKSTVSGSQMTTLFNGEALLNIAKKPKQISRWASITESGIYYAPPGSSGNPVSSATFVGLVVVLDTGNHFGIGRVCNSGDTSSPLYYTNGYQLSNIKWVQM